MDTLGLETLFAGENRRLRIQRIEDRLNQNDVGATIDQAVDLLAIGEAQIVKADSTIAGIVDVRRN